ncbi:MAG: ATP-binding protein [Nitrospinales bacterium]
MKVNKDKFPGLLSDKSSKLYQNQAIQYAKELAKLYQRERKKSAQLEEAFFQVRDTNAKLDRTYRELQNFLHIASHDLQEPTRKILNQVDLLSNHLKPGDPKFFEILARLQRSSHQLRNSMEDLLELSRASTQKLEIRCLNLNKELSFVLEGCHKKIRDCGANVEVGDLPPLIGDSHLMRVLFACLLDNSLKFHKKDTPPRIHISGRTQGGLVEICTQDEGIGFEMKYRDRIFKPFERLHGRSEFEGTGMGLAIVKNIITRLGGEIDIKSKPGAGTKVTLQF